jgi:hypothetical protein
MRTILVLLFAIVFPLTAEAQDGRYQWTASVRLEKGHATVCGSQDPRVIEIKDGVFKGADIVDGGTWTLPIRRRWVRPHRWLREPIQGRKSV